MKLIKLALAATVALTLGACSDKDTGLQDSLNGNTVDTISNLNFGDNIIPFPNNLLFLEAGAAPADGTLNIPVDNATDLSDPKVAMNALDGFSTVAPITTGFTGALDASSFPTGVKLYEVTISSGAVVSVQRMLSYGTEFVAALSSVDTTNSTMAILPLQPLKPKQAYMVVITNNVKSESGNAVGISGSYSLTHSPNPLHTGGVSNTALLTDAQAQQLEPLRQATVVAETSLNAFDSTASSDIILSWNFTTQSTSDVLAATRVQVQALAAVSGFSPTAATASPLGAADIHIGSLNVPYYLKVSSTASSPSTDPTALGSCWNGMGAGGAGSCAAGPHITQYNASPDPAAGSTETIPMMVSIPKSIGACASGMPAGGWPIVIYQHGITTHRATMLAIADAMAGACMAVVAIDMPMHGLTGTEALVGGFKDIGGKERTFDLDLVTEDASGNTTASISDGVIDSSGKHFINLSNLLNTRDNVRQAVSDLFVLVDAINEGAITDGTNTMDASKIYFLGHSLGAMVGTVFVALEPNVKASAFAFGGASLPKILDGSATFGPIIASGLAAKGVSKGTADYEAFIGAAQTVVDSGDPANFATAAAAGRGILFFEIVGGDSSPSDLVVPNRVPDGNDTSATVPAPLAGTDPQLGLMGLTHVNTSQTGVNLKLVTKFNSGSHASLLDPTDSVAVMTEIQKQAAKFLVTNGADLTVTDDTVLTAP